MEFDHESFGVKVVEFSAGTSEAEPHYSVLLSLNYIRLLSAEQAELTRGLPGEETREFLHALEESCRRALASLEANEERWKR
jgi:hypothetical protein